MSKWEIAGLIVLVILVIAIIIAVRKAGQQPPSRPGLRPRRRTLKRNRGFAGDHGDEAVPPREEMPPITEGEGFGPVRPDPEETPRE